MNFRDLLLGKRRVSGFSVYSLLLRRDRLPPEYQEVEYIESTGTQYIDTGLYAPDGFTAKMGINLLSIGTESCLIGMWQGDHRRYFGKISRWYLGAPGLYSAESIKANEYLEIEVSTTNDEYLKVNGKSQSLTAVSADKEYVNGNIPVFLLSVNVSKEPRAPAVARLYYCKIWDVNNKLVRDFVPCVRKSDKVAGMYDLVTGAFYENAGSDAFYYPGGPSPVATLDFLVPDRILQEEVEHDTGNQEQAEE